MASDAKCTGWPIKRARYAAVEAVDVGEIANLAFFIGFSGKVRDVNGDFPCQLDFRGLARCDHFADLRGIVTLIVGKQRLGQIGEGSEVGACSHG